MPIGTNAKINQFHNLSVTYCGSKLSGLISAEYALTRNINKSQYFTYGDMPEIQLSYTGHATSMGSFDAEEASSFKKITINGSEGGVTVAKALLSNFRCNFQIDGPFSVTKTFTGFAKLSSGGGGDVASNPIVAKRQDYTGSLPQGIQGNFLQSVTTEISINRQNIEEFASRRPYASVLSPPTKQSITYEVIASSMDSIVIDDLYEACKNPESTQYDASISVCGFSFSISKAYVTNIQYSGGEASVGSKPQTISITYTSYEDIPGLKKVIYFDDDGC